MSHRNGYADHETPEGRFRLGTGQKGRERVFTIMPYGDADVVREAYAQAKRVPGCPRCQAWMLRRNGKYGAFWGCSGYPACKGTRPMVIDMAPTGT